MNVAKQLNKCIGGEVRYEPCKIRYTKPARVSKYIPDFVLPNGIIIETKGRFVADDRHKHLLIKEQIPDLDIRFVFSNLNNRISKKSNTTYADWCDKHGFQYAKQDVPTEWIRESPDWKRLKALEKFM